MSDKSQPKSSSKPNQFLQHTIETKAPFLFKRSTQAQQQWRFRLVKAIAFLVGFNGVTVSSYQSSANSIDGSKRIGHYGVAQVEF